MGNRLERVSGSHEEVFSAQQVICRSVANDHMGGQGVELPGNRGEQPRNRGILQPLPAHKEKAVTSSGGE